MAWSLPSRRPTLTRDLVRGLQRLTDQVSEQNRALGRLADLWAVQLRLEHGVEAADLAEPAPPEPPAPTRPAVTYPTTDEILAYQAAEARLAQDLGRPPDPDEVYAQLDGDVPVGVIANRRRS